jgi:hypothetical protein
VTTGRGVGGLPGRGEGGAGLVVFAVCRGGVEAVQDGAFDASGGGDDGAVRGRRSRGGDDGAVRGPFGGAAFDAVGA